MIIRNISGQISKILLQFPILALTGARQVGKSTLLKALLKDRYRYVLLEDPDIREQANADPKSFLDRYPPPVIFDEFQNAPELANYLQGRVDENREKSGQYVLTGSQSFTLMKTISQSLAGRTGVLSMYGLDISEMALTPDEMTNESSLAQLILRGSFPELWAKKNSADIRLWYSSYVQTYLEKDIRKLLQVEDLAQFERFLRVLAARTGQLLNKSDVARDVGTSPTTIERWLSVLIATYQIHLVEPYYKNLSKRIKKAPKIYFWDTGLAAYLMGFRTPEILINSPQFHALFETLVITQFLKSKMNQDAEFPEHYFIETKTHHEVDFMVRNPENPNQWLLSEIKNSRTITPHHLKQLHSAQKLMGSEHPLILRVPIKDTYKTQNVTVLPWWE